MPPGSRPARCALELRLQFGDRIAHQRQPVGVVRAAGGERVRQVGGLDRNRAQMAHVLLEQRAQGRLGTRRVDERERSGHGRARRRGRVVLAQHDVRVGAAHPERAHPRVAAAAAGGPVHVLAHQVQAGTVRADLRVELAQVTHGGDLAVPHGQHDLDDRSQARSRFGVAEVALERADVARRRFAAVAFAAVALERARQGVELDRVAEPAADAVRFDVTDVAGLDPGVAQRRPDHRFLRGAVDRDQAVARPVLVDRGAAELSQHRVARRARVRQPAQHQRAAELAPHVPAGPLVERAAVPVDRHQAGPRERDVDLGREHQVHAAHDRQIDLARAQRLHG